MALVMAEHLQLAYIQACYEVELDTAEKQLEAEKLATRERIEHDIKDKIIQLQEEIVATELNEGRYMLMHIMYSVNSVLWTSWNQP